MLGEGSSDPTKYHLGEQDKGNAYVVRYAHVTHRLHYSTLADCLESLLITNQRKVAGGYRGLISLSDNNVKGDREVSYELE